MHENNKYKYRIQVRRLHREVFCPIDLRGETQRDVQLNRLINFNKLFLFARKQKVHRLRIRNHNNCVRARRFINLQIERKRELFILDLLKGREKITKFHLKSASLTMIVIKVFACI